MIHECFIAILSTAFRCQVPDGRRAGAVHAAPEPAARRHGHGAGDAAARHGPAPRRRRQVGAEHPRPSGL